MKISKTAKIFMIIGGSILLLGIGSAIAIPKIAALKAKGKKDEEIPDETGSGTQSTPPVTNVNPIGTTEDVKKFQDWMDKTHPNWLNNGKSLNKGGGYGNFGSQTSAAWNKYGTEYKTATGNKPSDVVRTFKIYSAVVGNPIYSNPNDTFPYRLAGKGEYLGELTGETKKSYMGVRYAEIKQAGGKLVYAADVTLSLKP